jgi:hypothetical protein
MGKIRDEVEFWWNNLTIFQKEIICNNHLPYNDYTSLDYHDIEYLWIKAKNYCHVNIKEIRKEKLNKLNNLSI